MHECVIERKLLQRCIKSLNDSLWQRRLRDLEETSSAVTSNSGAPSSAYSGSLRRRL
jgi:hypothetical protein